MTVAASPSGRQVTVGGSTVTAPQAYTWSPGSSHTLDIPSPQSGSYGVRYVFSFWSDGGGQSHSINPITDSIYTASFATQYQLTTSAAPAAASGGVSPDCTGACWYNSGISPTMTATPNNVYIFSSWSGNCTGTGLSTMLTMNASKSCTANFAVCASQPAKNATTSNLYPSINSAYNDATTANGDTIKILALVLGESLGLNRPLSVALKGGFDCSFNGNPSTSMVQGAVTVGNGIVTATNLIISPYLTIMDNGSVIGDNLIIQ